MRRKLRWEKMDGGLDRKYTAAQLSGEPDFRVIHKINTLSGTVHICEPGQVKYTTVPFLCQGEHSWGEKEKKISTNCEKWRHWDWQRNKLRAERSLRKGSEQREEL